MEMVAPAGPMYQAGTLSGNPLAMTAGIETLKRLKDSCGKAPCNHMPTESCVPSEFAGQEPGSYEYLDKITSKLINGNLLAMCESECIKPMSSRSEVGLGDALCKC